MAMQCFCVGRGEPVTFFVMACKGEVAGGLVPPIEGRIAFTSSSWETPKTRYNLEKRLSKPRLSVLGAVTLSTAVAFALRLTGVQAAH